MSSTTVRDYRRTVRLHRQPEFGADTPVESVTTGDIDEFRERMLDEARLSRRTIQKILVILHGSLKRAKRKSGSRRIRPRTPSGCRSSARATSRCSHRPRKALARAATSDQDAAIFVVAAFTGLRLGELRALRWRDVDFAKSLVVVRRNLPEHGVERVPKRGTVRSVPLVDRAAQVLETLSRRKRWTGELDHVFVNALGGPVESGRLRLRFRDARDRAKLKPLRVSRSRCFTNAMSTSLRTKRTCFPMRRHGKRPSRAYWSTVLEGMPPSSEPIWPAVRSGSSSRWMVEDMATRQAAERRKRAKPSPSGSRRPNQSTLDHESTDPATATSSLSGGSARCCSA
jgi:integrase